MSKHLYLLSFFILNFIFYNLNSLWAQNFVPNPSFEIYDTCPCGYNEIQYAPPWYNAGSNFGFVDYFNSCNVFGTMDVPKNSFGYQTAHTGVAYAGLGLYDIGLKSPRCYIGVKLTDSLEEGEKYCISFYISLADSSKYAINGMGAYLSDTMIHQTYDGPLPVTPQISSSSGVFLNDTVNWILVSGEYNAKGGEKFITIGNFKNNANTDTMISDSHSIYAYSFYYIDDVSVTLCDTINGIKNTYYNNNIIIISPNPAHDILSITWNNNPATKNYYTIYDAYGRLVMSEERVEKEFPIDISGFANGIYILKISSSNKTMIKKIIVER